MADLAVALLRLVHILAGAAWLGGALFMLLIVEPTVRKAPAAVGGGFMRTLATRSALAVYLPAVGGLTALAGLALYPLQGSEIESFSYPIVFHLSSLLGIAALLYGGATSGRLSRKLRVLAQGMGERPPTPDEAAQIDALRRKLRASGMVSLILLLATVAGMSTARYL